MPELPEVVTVSRSLNKEVKNTIIKKSTIIYNKLIKRPSIEEFSNKIKNQKILNVTNKAKYIIFEFAEFVMISHLRMEGKWAVENSDTYSYDKKHLEIEFELNNEKFLRYYDTRKFGTLELLDKDKYLQIPPISKLGQDPTLVDIESKYLQNKFSKSSRPIKTTLLDQGIIAGIGNIYANEILFSAKISPWTPTNKVNLEEIENIIKWTKSILLDAISKGGTTIHSFESSIGTQGKYQDYLKVHGKTGQKCVYCTFLISKDYIGGRGTYFCQKCQF